MTMDIEASLKKFGAEKVVKGSTAIYRIVFAASEIYEVTKTDKCSNGIFHVAHYIKGGDILEKYLSLPEIEAELSR